MLSPEAGVAVVVGIALGGGAFAVAPVDDGDVILGDRIAEHVFKVLLAVVVVVIDINMVETDGTIVSHPLRCVLVLAPANGAKGDACVHITYGF